MQVFIAGFYSLLEFESNFTQNIFLSQIIMIFYSEGLGHFTMMSLGKLTESICLCVLHTGWMIFLFCGFRNSTPNVVPHPISTKVCKIGKKN